MVNSFCLSTLTARFIFKTRINRKENFLFLVCYFIVERYSNKYIFVTQIFKTSFLVKKIISDFLKIKLITYFIKFKLVSF